MKEGMVYQLFAKACRESGFAIKPSNDMQVIYRFTELVVKECVKVCHQTDKEYEGEDVLASWCADDILKHFGIEE